MKEVEKLDKEIGERLKSLRKERKLTQQEVADRINVNHSYISKIEKGLIPSLVALKKLCDLYETSMPQLFGEEVEVPDELKELGVEWVSFAEEMKGQNLSPDDIKKYIEVVKTLKSL
ncbi:helix-turn-helix domain-containing protein [Peribacillus acanthi]|uniref:helix-turn-helix domain-containing protein n=1 Tax=Peribacillus acanthi TaxID=2171554 RepID=UPI000D3E5B01|nr:helix-turn-helix transcriptional regulator [Peribacillus acanthi]